MLTTIMWKWLPIAHCCIGNWMIFGKNLVLISAKTLTSAPNVTAKETILIISTSAGRLIFSSLVLWCKSKTMNTASNIREKRFAVSKKLNCVNWWELWFNWDVGLINKSIRSWMNRILNFISFDDTYINDGVVKYAGPPNSCGYLIFKK